LNKLAVIVLSPVPNFGSIGSETGVSGRLRIGAKGIYCSLR